MRLQLDCSFLAVSFKSPCRRYGSGRPSDDTVPAKVLGDIGSAMTREIVRRCDDDAWNHGDALRGGGRIGEATKSYRDIYGVPDDVMTPVPQLELYVQSRVPIGERREARNDVADAEAGRRAHSDEAAKFAALTNTVLSLVLSRHDRLDPCQKFS